MKLTNPPLRYYGGKWKIAPWIISFFPDHDSYIEPFGGGAGVLLRKKPSYIEVYNDINREVVNFFKVLRERPDELTRALELTPFSRHEFGTVKQGYEECDELEQARRFFVSSNQGRGRGGKLEDGGWCFSKSHSASRTTLDGYNKMIEQLHKTAARLRQVYIECDESLAIIDRYDSPRALFYIDPPYVSSVRCLRWRSDGYQHEYTDEQHIQLAASLQAIQGTAIVSGYESDLYNELYQGWAKHSRPAVKQNGTMSSEVIWINRNTRQPKLM